MVKTLDVDATYNWLKCKGYMEGVGDTLDLVVTGAFGSYQSCCKVGA